ncbi:hypothetical protein ACQK5W_05395 [Pantoea sp. FN060301]
MTERPDYDDPLPHHEVVTEFPEKEDDVPMGDDEPVGDDDD